MVDESKKSEDKKDKPELPNDDKQGNSGGGARPPGPSE
jgi:hypothetical protein